MHDHNCWVKSTGIQRLASRPWGRLIPPHPAINQLMMTSFYRRKLKNIYIRTLALLIRWKRLQGKLHPMKTTQHGKLPINTSSAHLYSISFTYHRLQEQISKLTQRLDLVESQLQNVIRPVELPTIVPRRTNSINKGSLQSLDVEGVSQTRNSEITPQHEFTQLHHGVQL